MNLLQLCRWCQWSMGLSRGNKVDGERGVVLQGGVYIIRNTSSREGMSGWWSNL